MSEKTADFIFLFETLRKGVQNIFEVVMTPEVLVSNAVHSVQSAFKLVFGEEQKVVMCWACMHRNVLQKIKSMVKIENRTSSLTDIETLQKLFSPESFLIAINLFFEKWDDQEHLFLLYFKQSGSTLTPIGMRAIGISLQPLTTVLSYATE